ncbi:MAG: hypothetical protein KAH38_04230, partial [Candidatus Hydrogenedentes bacterium]|nr:hypothetical protein [Candidatus Hydrogenedentota bacterium]
VQVLLVAALLTTIACADEWYKGGLHKHSFWSDGDVSPEQVTAWYKDHGWDFICYTDHNILLEGDSFKPIMEDKNLSPECVATIRKMFGDDWVEEQDQLGRKRMRLKTFEELKAYFEEAGKFLLIQGEEITTLGGNPHVGGINVVDRTGGLAKGDKVALASQYMQSVASQSEKYRQPMISILNHPNFSDAITAEEAVAMDPLRYFEVYNGHPSVKNWGHEGKGYPSTDKFWDIVLSLRLQKDPAYILYGVGTDDAHNYKQMGKGANPGRGWVMVKAAKLTVVALLDAMEKGSFYVSTGILLDDIQRNASGLSFVIKVEPGITYTTQFFGTPKGFSTVSEPVLDENGDVKPRASRKYSDEVGVLLAETSGTSPSYVFKGDEMYVRAKVTSTKLHPNPFKEGDYEMAWTQPVIAP